MAGRKKKEITVTLFVGGQQVNTLTTQQIEKIQERLENKMSVYYTAHADEYVRL